MSKEQDLTIDDLDIDILSQTLPNLQLWDLKLANIQKERDKVASVVTRHMARIADAKGIILEDHDINLAEKRFVPKLQPTVVNSSLP